jgi:hypothetical protein
MLLGAVLMVIPHAERAPDGVALVWSLMSVEFTLDAELVHGQRSAHDGRSGSISAARDEFDASRFA